MAGRARSRALAPAVNTAPQPGLRQVPSGLSSALRVALSRSDIREEALNIEWARQSLRQRGLATRYLVKEIDPDCAPLGPEK